MSKQAYTEWMSKQFQIEKINRTGMSYKMRLSAIIAVDNRKGVTYA